MLDNQSRELVHWEKLQGGFGNFGVRCHAKAKYTLEYRFYSLFDKYRGGGIEAYGVERWLGELAKEPQDKRGLVNLIFETVEDFQGFSTIFLAETMKFRLPDLWQLKLMPDSVAR